MKLISVMGSTGSVGTQTLDVVRNHKDINVCGLSCGKNIALLEKQVREFRPKLAVTADEKDAAALRIALSDLDVRVASGMEGLLELAQMEESSLFVTAIDGMIGMKPTVAAIKAGKDIALANKETLVVAGHIIMPLAAKKNINLLPIDSEHSAIFQCLQGVPKKADGKYPLRRIWLTASGGAFRGLTKDQVRDKKAADALIHPNWKMGRKISIDTATLVNKGLEILEAGWLFNLDVDDITVLVQPKSIVHSMVELEDGSVLAKMGVPDMRLPIQFALVYPNRCDIGANRLDFLNIPQISFERPDNKTFRGIPLAVEAARIGGSMPAVLNIANEAAVSLYLEDRIGFLDIYEIIEEAMGSHTVIEDPGLDQILEIEKVVRAQIKERW